ncbi:MAG: MRP family ATP-binding protein [Salinarimonadaceae bacterium]|nr:MAG: MRP family ATP-binding protein [Salinarimonadaceae bacterium]
MTDQQHRTDAARAALEAVPLPAGGTLGASGRVSGFSFAQGRVIASITIAPEEAQAFAAVREAAQAALLATPGVAAALVALTSERSSAPAAPPPHPAPAAPAGKKPPVLPDVTHVVAVASGKGGVGKSTTTVNLALGLRALGLKVGILDADIYGPSLPTLLGLRGQPKVGADRKLAPMQAYGLKVMSIGLLVDEETAMIWRGPMVMSAITQMLAEVEWGRLDFLLVDMPPGTGDAQLAIAQGARLSGAVIVSTPQDLSLIDARRGVAMFRKVDVPILGIVENMSHFICTDCGARHAIFGEGGAEAEAKRIGAPFLGAVPLTMELRRASDLGQPVTALDPDGVTGRIFVEIAGRLRERLS